MIKLSLVKKFGIELVSGDMVTSSDKSGSAAIISRTAATYFNGVDTEDYRPVECFATRLISDGIPTSIDGDVVLELSNGKGLVSLLSARNAAWHVWTTWRPSMEWLVQQASDKSVTYKDDTQHFGEDVQVDLHNVTYVPEGFVSGHTVKKPAFTQAMADAGELPPVGSECQIMLDGYWQTCFMVGLSKSGNPVIQMGVHCIESIGCDYKPLDTRTEKKKLVDAALLDISAEHHEITNIGTVVACMINVGYRKLTPEQIKELGL